MPVVYPTRDTQPAVGFVDLEFRQEIETQGLGCREEMGLGEMSTRSLRNW